MPKDALIVSVFGGETESARENFAEEVIGDILGWIRNLTHQWWAGRPIETLTGNLQLSIGLNEQGLTIPRVTAYAGQPDPSARSIALTPEIWQEVGRKIWVAAPILPIDSLIADVSYYAYLKDYRTAIILACSTFEVQRDIILETNQKKISELKSNSTDILKHVSKGFDEIFERNMKKENPKAYEFLESCWVARNNVAHGKPALWKTSAGRKDFSEVPLDTFIDGVASVSAWLASVP